MMVFVLSEDLSIALLGAIVIDLIFGDPSNNYHPVAWLGGLIGFFAPRLKDNGSNCTKKERFRGIIFSISLIIAFGIITHIGAFSAVHLLGSIGLIIFSVLILKITIAIRGMEKHAKAIMSALERRDLINARYNLSMIVRRDTKNLDDQHVISGTIECIGESVVDGIISPLFYYSLFGPAGAFVYRIINTLDSMIGYNDNYYKDIGWMSATLDTIGNYIPARITAFLMVIVATIIGEDSKQSMQILKRDHNKTTSPNAGYPMATLAGALRIKLEKVGYYSIGEGYEPSSIRKCKTAISIMKLTTILFCLVFSVPLITILYLVGWWRLLFGL
jgi:adenosylcobinamide-phosphate synthase